MQIESSRTQGCLNLKLSGRLETSTAPKLQEVVEKELEGTDELRMDMEGIEYVSSAGLRVLLAASKEMKAKGGKMVVSHVNDDVMEVFEITGFKEILTIE
ncbi:MAG: STAS domain-containing protein [Lachnospiraceae bacterium]|nr:STAS domain-containing protein [Lachnospiraceae bacterium]